MFSGNYAHQDKVIAKKIALSPRLLHCGKLES
jgi:hypothetical protein